MTQGTTYNLLKLTEKDHAEYEFELQKLGEGIPSSRKHYPIYSDGRGLFFVNTLARGSVTDYNPAEKTSIVSVFPEANSDDVDRAVETASKASGTVRKLGWENRLEILQNARPLVEREKYRIAACLTLEVGKVRGEGVAEAMEVVAMIDAYEKFLTEERFYRRELADGSEVPYEKTVSSMESVGPTPVIVPFNFPFALCANMSMAAFLAGNPVIIKPPEDAPLASLLWRGIMVEAGAPEEAVLFLPGDGKVGKMLAEHPSREIGRVAFTGSMRVGVELTISCAMLGRQGINRKVIAELGSKNPVIVTRNADLAKAASGITRSVTGFSGQKCSAASRVYVERPVMEELIARMTDPVFLKPYTVGDPAKRSTWTGPLVNEEAYRRYQLIVRELGTRSRKESIKVMAFCNRESADMAYMGDLQEHGYYVTPLLVLGIDHEDHLARYEHFVPLVTIHPVDSLAEAVEKANDTNYGLCAGLFSEDPREQEYFQDNIRFGVPYVNRALGATTGSWPGIQSFGGWGMSGLGGVNAFGPWYPLLFAREQCRTVVLR